MLLGSAHSKRLLAKPVVSGLLFLCIGAAQNWVMVPGTSVIKKVVAGSENVAATKERGGPAIAYKLEVQVPYFVLYEDSQYYRITGQQSGGGPTGFVKKSQVKDWSTVEGLFFLEKTIFSADRPKLRAWKDDATYEKFVASGGDPRYGAAYEEVDLAQKPLPNLLKPYPVVRSKEIKIGDSKRMLYQVLLPAYVNREASVVLEAPKAYINKVVSRVTFCVVFDATGSMAMYAKQMADRVETLLKSLRIGPAEISVGFVFFRDMGDKERYLVVKPASMDEAMRTLRSMADRMDGGGDPAEPVLDAAVIAATDFPWGISGEKRVAIVVLNDDAKVETIGLSPAVAKGHNASEVGSLLRSRNITAMTLQAGDADGGSLASTLQTVASQTGGEYYPHSGASEAAFGSKVRSIITNKVAENVDKVEKVMKNVTTSVDGKYTVIPLGVLDPEMLARLRDAAKSFNIEKGGLVINEGWMPEQQYIYQEEIMVEKSVVDGLVNIFNVIASSTLDCKSMENTVRENLKTMVGEEIKPDVEIQELVEKRLGIHFKQGILEFPLDHLCGLTGKERLATQKRMEEASKKLANFADANAANFQRQRYVWMRLSYLP